MLGIIEAGGTKTEVRTGNSQQQIQVTGKGINPYIQNDEKIKENLKEIFQNTPEKAQIKILRYYGAGCAHPDQADRIRRILNSHLPDADIKVESDLLGTARALCGKSPGLACILGTGSNACFYDGTAIIRQMTSLGFWLGDEGSGGYLGKLLFKKWYKNELESSWDEPIENLLQVSKSKALEKLYEIETPNSWLAKLATLILDNQKTPEFAKIIDQSIDDFFIEIEGLLHSGSEKFIHFSGSVGWYLKPKLEQKIIEIGFKPGVFLQSPGATLFKFHLDHPTI
jgi:glucosamine kinase